MADENELDSLKKRDVEALERIASDVSSMKVTLMVIMMLVAFSLGALAVG